MTFLYLVADKVEEYRLIYDIMSMRQRVKIDAVDHNPLFDVMFALQNTGEGELDVEGLKFTEYDYDQKGAKFDLTFTASEMDDGILFNVEYSVNLFKRETIERRVKHFCNLLHVIIENSDIQLGEIDILSMEERKQLLHEFNDTNVEYPREKTIHQNVQYIQVFINMD